MAQDILIAMFVFVVVTNVYSYLRSFLPWLDRVLSESKRVASLLSDFPAEINIEQLIVRKFGADTALFGDDPAGTLDADDRDHDAGPA